MSRRERKKMPGRKPQGRKKKPIPDFRDESEEREFWETHSAAGRQVRE
jgi:hypothetical protein